jgi:hypothetical protein
LFFHSTHFTPSVCLPESFAPSARLNLFPECYVFYRSFCLRVSGVVAPSALIYLVSPDVKEDYLLIKLSQILIILNILLPFLIIN